MWGKLWLIEIAATLGLLCAKCIFGASISWLIVFLPPIIPIGAIMLIPALVVIIGIFLTALLLVLLVAFSPIVVIVLTIVAIGAIVDGVSKKA